MSKLPAAKDSYEKTRRYLLGLGVNAELISCIDRLDSPKKEELTSLLSEIVEDETQHVLALLDREVFQNFLETQRLKKKGGFTTRNVIPFPLK